MERDLFCQSVFVRIMNTWIFLLANVAMTDLLLIRVMRYLLLHRLITHHGLLPMIRWFIQNWHPCCGLSSTDQGARDEAAQGQVGGGEVGPQDQGQGQGRCQALNWHSHVTLPPSEIKDSEGTELVSLVFLLDLSTHSITCMHPGLSVTLNRPKGKDNVQFWWRTPFALIWLLGVESYCWSDIRWVDLF